MMGTDKEKLKGFFANINKGNYRESERERESEGVRKSGEKTTFEIRWRNDEKKKHE